MLWNLDKHRPQMTFLHEKCPLGYCFDNKTIETKDGHLCRVIELDGIDYTGMGDKSIESLFLLRRQFLESVGTGLVPTIYTHRYKLSKALGTEDHGDIISNRICEEWSKNFSSTYRNRHYIVYRTKSAGLLDRAANKLSGEGESYESRIKRLDAIQLTTEKNLHDYQPRVLEGEALASFWSMLLNGKTSPVKMPANGVIEDALTGCDLYWPSDRPNVQIYEDNKDRFSTWITLKIFEDEEEGLSPSVFNELFSLQCEYLLNQSFILLDKASATDKVKKLRNRMKGAGDNEDIQLKIDQLDELIAELEADKVKLCDFRFALQVFADTEEELTNVVSDVESVISSYRFKSKRERALSEPLFWSMFPGNEEKLNPRSRCITSSNLACHINFSSIGEGMNACDWGDMPVIPFLTENESEYSFCFHLSPNPKALGHTLMVGGSESGKTTLMQMLMTHARKYPGMKQIALDYLRGMEIGIRIQGGSYTSFDHSPPINPLQLPDTPSNRQFLAKWLKTLSKQDSNAAIEIINNSIQKNYTLQKHERNLENLTIAFGLEKEGSFRENMSRWLPGGVYGSYFNGQTDSLQFDKPIVGFDMTQISKSPDVLAPMAEYMYHCIETMLRDNPSPLILWTDEYINYINNPILAPLQVKAKAQYRRLGAVCVDAVQDVSHVVGTLEEPNKIGIETISSYATFVFFPDPSADYELLSQYFGINEAEYKWIRDPTNRRKILVKRKNGTSAILNIDMSCLGKLLNAYRSDTDKVSRVHELMREHPSNWKRKYLDET